MQTFKVLPTYSVTRQKLRPCNCDRSIQWTVDVEHTWTQHSFYGYRYARTVLNNSLPLFYSGLKVVKPDFVRPLKTPTELVLDCCLFRYQTYIRYLNLIYVQFTTGTRCQQMIMDGLSKLLYRCVYHQMHAIDIFMRVSIRWQLL